MRDFTIKTAHRAGELAVITAALARAGVNVRSVAGISFGDEAIMHVMVDDLEAARLSLSESRISFVENEVITLLLEDRAGELAQVADRLRDARINLQAIYCIGYHGDLVEFALVVDNSARARELLKN